MRQWSLPGRCCSCGLGTISKGTVAKFARPFDIGTLKPDIGSQLPGPMISEQSGSVGFPESSRPGSLAYGREWVRI